MLLPRVLSRNIEICSGANNFSHTFCGSLSRKLGASSVAPSLYLQRRTLETSSSESSAKSSFLDRVVFRHGPAAIRAPDGFNRWLVAPAAVSFHMCLGSVYSWSILNSPLTKTLGVVGCSAADWTLGSVVPVFSTAIFFLGMTAAVAGKHIDRYGPRIFGLASAALWGSGHLVSAAAVHFHSLPLLYVGYGVMGGIGLGLGYLAPVGLLMSWFPERRGMATGLAIMGFGGGAIAMTPVMTALLQHFRAAPTLAASMHASGQYMDARGVRFASLNGETVEVVSATAKDVVAFPGLQEGLYAVGTGNTGLVSTFACLGMVYSLTMAGAAVSWRMPPLQFQPSAAPGQASVALEGRRIAGRRPVGVRTVDVQKAMQSPQFYFLWMNLCLNTTAGIGMIGVAKDMVGEIFGNALPHLVTTEFAASYVLAVSLANMSGRFFWATVSDYIGRKPAYYVYFCLGVPLYLSLPCWAMMTQSNPEVALGLFCASTMVTFSTFGAGFSTMPAYVADVFGPKHTSAIFGRILTAWSAAGLLGPLAITQLRARAEQQAATVLAEQLGAERFAAAFQAPIGELDALLASKAVTVQRLLELLPAGTVDPTPYMYNEVMMCMAGLQLLAIYSNSRIKLPKPVWKARDPEIGLSSLCSMSDPVGHRADSRDSRNSGGRQTSLPQMT
eukprot:TRINITY_DN22700_c0_g1_i3.p1 TRINITY_DN22700_c0_g1~~TRINITY_DN22700_c0_g1_i3.p1  ORF type:complete len:670 (+),score=55.06 TRINITY_DN22700_c0_g1_i3:37-2046(+)